MTPFDVRVKIMYDICRLGGYRKEFYADLLEDNAPGFYTAYLVHTKIITDLTEMMTTLVDGAWGQLLEKHGLEDTGFDEFWEVDGNLPTKEQFYTDRGFANE